jgi:RNA polymerase sigma-32 factor
MAANLGNDRTAMVRLAMQAPYLERDEEQALAQAWRDEADPEALHRLTEAHLRLVVSLATRFRGFGLPFGDLVQEGYVGLLEAAARFDPDRDVRFATYATWWVRAAMQDFVLRNWSIVRGGTSSSQKALFFGLRRLRARLAQAGEAAGGRILEEIAEALGVPTADVEQMNARLSGPDVSLNAPVQESGPSTTVRQDFLVDRVPLPDETVSEAIDQERRRVWLRQALKELTERELRIVAARRLRENTVTLESLGDSLGISKERVRQIEARALEKLKSALLRDHPDAAVQNAP